MRFEFRRWGMFPVAAIALAAIACTPTSSGMSGTADMAGSGDGCPPFKKEYLREDPYYAACKSPGLQCEYDTGEFNYACDCIAPEAVWRCCAPAFYIGSGCTTQQPTEGALCCETSKTCLYPDGNSPRVACDCVLDPTPHAGISVGGRWHCAPPDGGVPGDGPGGDGPGGDGPGGDGPGGDGGPRDGSSD